jgi:SAM-dependent methyltransferase
VSGPGPRDLEELKRAQRDAWGAVAAPWDRWADTFEAFAGPVSTELARLAGVRTGQRVLDLGCGTGAPALELARRVGPQGSVLGVDLAEPMAALARERAARAGIGWARFEAGDAEALAIPGPLDAAVSRFALMLMPRPERAVANVRAALKPGARFAAAVWGTDAEVPFCDLGPMLAERELGMPRPPPDMPSATRLGAPGALSAVLRAGGLERVEEHALAVEVAFASAADCARFLTDISQQIRKALEERGAAERERFWRLVEREAARWAGADGRVRMPCTVRVAVGERPT